MKLGVSTSNLGEGCKGEGLSNWGCGWQLRTGKSDLGREGKGREETKLRRVGDWEYEALWDGREREN